MKKFRKLAYVLPLAISPIAFAAGFSINTANNVTLSDIQEYYERRAEEADRNTEEGAAVSVAPTEEKGNVNDKQTILAITACASLEDCIGKKGKVKEDFTNFKTSPDGEVIGQLSKDIEVTIVDVEGDWLLIDMGGGSAYVHSKWIDVEGHTNSIPDSGTITEDAKMLDNTGAVIEEISAGIDVEILGDYGTYWKVSYKDTEGYIVKALVDTDDDQDQEPENNNEDHSSEDSDEDGEEVPADPDNDGSDEENEEGDSTELATATGTETETSTETTSSSETSSNSSTNTTTGSATSTTTTTSVTTGNTTTTTVTTTVFDGTTTKTSTSITTKTSTSTNTSTDTGTSSSVKTSTKTNTATKTDTKTATKTNTKTTSDTATKTATNTSTSSSSNTVTGNSSFIDGLGNLLSPSKVTTKVYKQQSIGSNWDESGADFTHVQGICCDGTYFYVALLTSKKGSDYTQQTTKILKINMSTKKVVKAKRIGKIGHSNSLCYNTKNKKIYSATCEGKMPYWCEIDTDLTGYKKIYPKKADGSKYTTGWASFSYDPVKDQYVAKGSNKSMAFFDKNFKFIKKIALSTSMKIKDSYTGQAVYCDGKNFFSQCTDFTVKPSVNYIVCYDMNGKYLQKITLKGFGELEQLTGWKGKYYTISNHNGFTIHSIKLRK